MPKLIKTSIELGREYGGENSPSSPDSEGIYVTLPDVSELKSLPESGEITFHYCRKNLNLGEEDKLSATLCLCRILGVKADPEEEGDGKTSDLVDQLFAEAQKENDDGKEETES